MARRIYIMSWNYLNKIYAGTIPTNNCYNAEESVIILRHVELPDPLSEPHRGAQIMDDLA